MATEKELEKIVREVGRRTRRSFGERRDWQEGRQGDRALQDQGKHFILAIGEGTFSYKRNEVKIGQEEALDGIYVVRTSEPADRLCAEDTVRSYKNLAHVERAFRSLKGIDLLIQSDLALYGGPCPGSHLYLYVGVLCGVAHAQGSGAAFVWR